MRARYLSPLLLVLFAAPLQGQTCSADWTPDIPTLFPQSIEGMGRQFYNRVSGCYTNVYRPTATAGQKPMWAVVSIEPNGDPFLGTDAAGLAAHYERSNASFVTVEDWPVAVTHIPDLGDEFVTLRGPVRVTVLIKDGDGAERSERLAKIFMAEIFAMMPCGSGT